MTDAVIALTLGCAIATPVLLLFIWLRPPGLRCVLAVVLGLALVVLGRRVSAETWFIQRPFVAYHFTPLYPHSADSSFPSATTAYFAVAAVAALCARSKAGWIIVVITLEVAFGCVYVGVHYVSDVVAGAILGAASGGISWLILGYPPIARFVRNIDGALCRIHLRRAAGNTSQPRISRAG
jgi:membrane-associated phospholipid phosphatase